MKFAQLKILFPSNLLGVEVLVSGADYTFLCTEAKIRAGNISVKRTQHFDSITELIESGIVKSRFIVLSIDSMRCVHRAFVQNSENKGGDEALSYLQEADIQIQERLLFQHTTISACSTDVIEAVIQKFEKYQVKILRLDIGPFNVLRLRQKLDTKLIKTGIRELEIAEGNVLKLSKKPISDQTSYKIDATTIDGKFLPAFSNCLEYLVNDIDGSVEISKSPAYMAPQDLIWSRVYRLCMIYMLLLSALTFGSFFYGEYLNNRLDVLRAQTAEVRTKAKQIDKLENQSDDIMRFSNKRGLSLNSKGVKDFNTLLLTVIEGISFNSVWINPIIEKRERNVTNQNLSRFQFGEILVSGNSISERKFDEWVQSLNNSEYRHSFELLVFKRDKRSDRINFELLFRNES